MSRPMTQGPSSLGEGGREGGVRCLHFYFPLPPSHPPSLPRSLLVPRVHSVLSEEIEEHGREGGMEGGRERGREGRREGGSEEIGKEGGREGYLPCGFFVTLLHCVLSEEVEEHSGEAVQV